MNAKKRMTLVIVLGFAAVLIMQGMRHNVLPPAFAFAVVILIAIVLYLAYER